MYSILQITTHVEIYTPIYIVTIWLHEQNIKKASLRSQRFLPAQDTPLRLIGPESTISAPHMHATMLELLLPHLRPDGRALDVGAGAHVWVAIQIVQGDFLNNE